MIPFSPFSFCLFSPFPFVEPPFSHSPSRPSFSRMIPPFTAFSNHFLSFPFAELSSLLSFVSLSLFWPSPPYNRTWWCQQSGAIHKPINSGNKLDRRATYSDPRPSPRTRRWILLATFFVLTSSLFDVANRLVTSEAISLSSLKQA